MPRILILLALLCSLPSADVWAYGSYRFSVPNGDRFGCTLCHLSDPPTFPYELNVFGKDVLLSFSGGGGAPQWNATLAKKDSDADGYTNGEELHETTGNLFAWEPRRTGSGENEWDVSSGIPSLVRNPGDGALSVPTVRFDPIRAENIAIYVGGIRDTVRTRVDSVNVGERIQVTLSAQANVPNRSLTLRLLGGSADLEGVQFNILTRENLLSGDVTRYLSVERITATLTWTPTEQQGGDHALGIELSDGTTSPIQTVRVVVFGGIVKPPEIEPPPLPPPVLVSSFTAATFDFDNSLLVDLADFVVFAQSFGQSASRAGRFDFDKSGVVDWRDFLFFTYFFNKRINNDLFVRSPARDQVAFVPIPGGGYVQEINGLFQQINILPADITKTEIVNRQYTLFLISKNGVLSLTPAPFKGVVFENRAAALPEHPVVGVSWEMADAYCKWLGARLPTRAEWNFAARGTSLRAFAHGDQIANNQANGLNSGDPFEPGTTPVGYYNGRDQKGYQTQDAFSLYGAYDMTGNVWEWCSDVREDKKAPVMGASYLEDVHSPEFTLNSEQWMDVGEKLPNVGFRCFKEK
jgi:hypothetical protein